MGKAMKGAGFVGLTDVAPQVAAACGDEYTTEELEKIGERIWNMERDFNNNAGFTSADDSLPKRLLTEAAKTGPSKGSMLPEMLPKYYEVRGWNSDGTIKPKCLLLFFNSRRAHADQRGRRVRSGRLRRGL